MEVRLGVCVQYMIWCAWIYINTCVHICIYILTKIQRKRERSLCTTNKERWSAKIKGWKLLSRKKTTGLKPKNSAHTQICLRSPVHSVVAAILTFLYKNVFVVKNFEVFRRSRTLKSSARITPMGWEAWWLNGSVPDCCPAVLGSNLVSPQPTAACQSPGGLPPGMALG